MEARTRKTCPALSAVVVYFRTPGALEACLAALRSQAVRPNEVVVVDNSSALDGLTERPAGGEDWAWLRSTENVGFGAACNAGARYTSGEYILFLNVDLQLSPDACLFLLRAAREHSDTAVLGPRIQTHDGEIELSARSFPSPLTGVTGRRSIVTRALRFAGIRPPGFTLEESTQPSVVDWVSGACMLVRRSAFEGVGGFDQGYWMYWEDADLCKRLSCRGWGTRMEPKAIATHATGSSGTSAGTVRAFHASAFRYYATHIARNEPARKLGRLLLEIRCRAALFSRRRQLSR